MAMTIVESTRPVTGGVDTHLDQHVAAALDATGALLGVESFRAMWDVKDLGRGGRSGQIEDDRDGLA